MWFFSLALMTAKLFPYLKGYIINLFFPINVIAILGPYVGEDMMITIMIIIVIYYNNIFHP